MQLGATYGTTCITIIQPDFELETTLRIIEENAELEGHTKMQRIQVAINFFFFSLVITCFRVRGFDGFRVFLESK